MQIIELGMRGFGQAVYVILALFLLVAAAGMRSRLKKWVEVRMLSIQRDTLHLLAAEAAALVESTAKSQRSDEKLSRAYRYVSARIGDLKLEENPETIRAAIEKAVMDYNAMVKPPHLFR